MEEKLKNLRLTQKQLADKIGVSQQTISKWINGVATPRIEHFKSFSKILNISIDELNQIIEQKKIANETCGSMAISETDK